MDHRIKYKTTIKILQKNLWDLTVGKEFLDMTPKAQSIREISKLDFIKIKNFCSVKYPGKRMKKNKLDWEKI